MKQIFILAVLVLTMLACATKTKPDTTTTPAGQQQTVENYIKAYNNFDIAGMLSTLHPDVYFENVTNGQVDLTTQGIDAFKKQAEQAKGFFHEREQTITGIQFSGDTVTVQIDYRGVLAGDLPNGMKAGDTLKLRGKSTFVFKDSRIARIKDES